METSPVVRLKLAAPLGPHLPFPTADPLARPPRSGDAPRLAALMRSAYRGTIDDHGEDLAAAAAEVVRLFGGRYGDFDWTASEVIERNGELVCATLVTVFDGLPLVAFSMTSAHWKRRGLARAGLARVMKRLRDAGRTRVQLAVTAGNSPARALYDSLGFVRV